MRYRNLTIAAVLLVGGLGIYSSCTTEPPKEELACSAKVITAAVAPQVSVELTVTNNLKTDVRYLDRHNPFSKHDDPFFEVSRVDQTKDYHGYVYRYDIPSEQDFATLAQSETLTTTYPLSDYYDFSESGDYLVEPHLHLVLLNDGEKADEDGVPATEEYELACDTLTVSLSQGVERSSLVAKTFPAQPRLCTRYSNGFPRTACRPRFRGNCAGFMNMAAFEDIHKGMWLSTIPSVQAIEANKPGVSEWFGSLSSQQHSQLKSDMGGIKNFFNHQVIHYYCLPADSRCFDNKGKQSVIAFVYPSLLYADIYMCPRFATLPDYPKGGARDTKAGTLVHEASHLPRAFTHDHKYGQYWSKWLARYAPYKAIKNADNFQYFYENHQ